MIMPALSSKQQRMPLNKFNCNVAASLASNDIFQPFWPPPISPPKSPQSRSAALREVAFWTPQFSANLNGERTFTLKERVFLLSCPTCYALLWSQSLQPRQTAVFSSRFPSTRRMQQANTLCECEPGWEILIAPASKCKLLKTKECQAFMFILYVCTMRVRCWLDTTGC